MPVRNRSGPGRPSVVVRVSAEDGVVERGSVVRGSAVGCGRVCSPREVSVLAVAPGRMSAVEVVREEDGVALVRASGAAWVGTAPGCVGAVPVWSVGDAAAVPACGPALSPETREPSAVAFELCSTLAGVRSARVSASRRLCPSRAPAWSADPVRSPAPLDSAVEFVCTADASE